MKKTGVLWIVFIMMAVGVAHAQGTRAEYQRAEQVMKGSLGKLVVDGTVAPNWLSQASRMWYRKTAGESKEFVMIDGMGTDGRSHAFHAVSHKNLGDGGLPDHIAAVQQLAAKYPFMDVTHGVGIYGHSAGGYNSTNALLTHPEFYKVAVSSAGNHDHRLDKAGWVEQWMGYPAGKWYEEQSNITLAPKLQGKLLLAVGDVDDNVTPVSTLKLAAALVQAGKDFDLIIMPNSAHGFGNDPYFVRRRWDFFVRHLMGAAPPEGCQIAR